MLGAPQLYRGIGCFFRDGCALELAGRVDVVVSLHLCCEILLVIIVGHINCWVGFRGLISLLAGKDVISLSLLGTSPAAATRLAFVACCRHHLLRSHAGAGWQAECCTRSV